jgi:hypothetical protein
VKRHKKRVYVLGAGPAGLLAADAADALGYDVTVFSKPNPSGLVAKSQLYGCQYLHAPVPSPVLAGAPNQVTYTLQGEVAGYRDKVYGPSYHGAVSPDEYGTEVDHKAWDLRRVYEALWRNWQWDIVPVDIGPGQVHEMLDSKPHLLVSTIPAPQLCINTEHLFPEASVWAFGEAPNRISPVRVPPFTVQCNGEPDVGWYRAANVYGYTTVEWPARRKPPIDGVVRVAKPISTNCDCWCGNKRYLRAGRFGRWQKGVLVHEAYKEVYEWLR